MNACAAWREIVDSLRMLGAILLQPALCATLGLLPARPALWGAATLGALAATATAVAALVLYRPRTSADARRARLLGDSSSSGDHTDGTPETLHLSSSASGDETTTCSSGHGRRPESLGSSSTEGRTLSG